MKVTILFGLASERPYLMIGLKLMYFWLTKSAELLGNRLISKSESADFKFESASF